MKEDRKYLNSKSTCFKHERISISILDIGKSSNASSCFDGDHVQGNTPVDMTLSIIEIAIRHCSQQSSRYKATLSLPPL
jgi:hypothetical protein